MMKYSLIAVLMSCALNGCSNATTEESTSIGNGQLLIPLSVGTAWQYYAADTSIGVPIPYPIVPDSSFRVRVTRDSVTGGQTWAALENGDRLFGPSTAPAIYFGNFGHGFNKLEAGPLVAVSILLFPFPTRLGQQVQFGPTTSAVDTVITVPAGTFHCIRYDFLGQPVPGPYPYWSVFIAPGVGVIQRIVEEATTSDSQNQITGRRLRQTRLIGVQVLP
jgi:hypothetical protein